MKKSKRVKKSNSWKIKQHRDPYFKNSKIQGYRSRASFKLIELNKKFKFLKKNSYILDLGSAPGSWSQVASKIANKGKILSIDIKRMEPVNNVCFVKSGLYFSHDVTPSAPSGCKTCHFNGGRKAAMIR